MEDSKQAAGPSGEAVIQPAGADSTAARAWDLDLKTDVAPSFPGVFGSIENALKSTSSGPPLQRPPAGEFEMLQEIGRGASGVVYLARQLRLNRQVALKVTHNVGAEAQTMAALEHPNIVAVFSETLSEDSTLRLICLQYVAGITLADLLVKLRDRGLAAADAATLTNLLADDIGSDALPVDVDVESSPRRSYAEAICAIAAKIADALGYAHKQGVLHRDVKPANILLNRSGQPLLTDFSLASHSPGGLRENGQLFGGTLAYMAPEHLAAFCQTSKSSRDAVDERSDIYSLGLVIYELLSLDPPHLPSAELPPTDACRQLAEERKKLIPRVGGGYPEIANPLNWLLAKCMAPDPNDRFQTAEELAASLRGCERLGEIHRSLPGSNPITNWWTNHLSLTTFCVGAAANLLAVMLGLIYVYTTPRVIADLSEDGRNALLRWFSAHTIVATMIMLAVVVWNIHKLKRPASKGNQAINLRSVRSMAFQSLSRLLAMEVLVWLPGLVVTPFILARHHQSLSPWLIGEFMAGYTVLMLVAVSLTYFAGAYTLVRIAYPFLWNDVRNLSSDASQELRVVRRDLRRFHLLAGAIPLIAASGLLLVGPENFEADGYALFRLLGIGLIAGGAACLVAMGLVRTTIDRTIQLFANDEV